MDKENSHGPRWAWRQGRQIWVAHQLCHLHLRVRRLSDVWERRELRRISSGLETAAVARAVVSLTNFLLYVSHGHSPLLTPAAKILEALIPDGMNFLCKSRSKSDLDEPWWVLWSATQLPRDGTCSLPELLPELAADFSPLNFSLGFSLDKELLCPRLPV